jgi:phosphate transport system substrate-binding protein
VAKPVVFEEANIMKHNGSRAAAGLLIAGSLALAACTHLDTPPTYARGVNIDCGGKKDLIGSGSTAQANAMTHFITSYEETCSGKQLSYTASGSGAGIQDFVAAKTDFGGSDSPLNGDEYAAAKQRCGGADAWNLPAVYGPIGITFNVKTTDVLTLDGPTLAKIFSGAITRWDDPAITALNGNMPSEDIHVVYRSDASGTSDNFQQYLQAASGGAWTKGTGKTFNGGVGTSAQGNEGTSEAVKKTEGAISYNEWSYAMESRRRAESFTSATTGSVRPSRMSPSKARAMIPMTLCSTSRRSTPPLRLAPTQSCWPVTKSFAPNTLMPMSVRQ